tara:strand:- start:11636 stop:12466 length:831 start_codon:yes stop_codon:yes gene_type:complete
MESVRLIKTYIISNIKSLFTSRQKKEYLHNFFKREELKYETKNGLDFFIIPKQYYLWKGINTNDRKNRNVDIENKDTDVMLKTLSSYFFADKNTASLYGTQRTGVDLQFKIVEDIVLLDISSLKTITTLFRYIKNLTMEDVESNEYLLKDYENELRSWNEYPNWKKKYPTKEDFFEKKWKVNLRELITDTLGNYEAKETSNGSIGSPKTPTKVDRKSNEFFDILLVKFICSMTNFGYNGWIYFRINETNTKGSIFHDEIMICNPNDCIEYVDYHKK